MSAEEKEANPGSSGGGQRRSALRFRGYYLVLLLVLAIGVDFVATGLWVIDRNEQGVIRRFGKTIRVCSSGMQIIFPYPIETLDRVATSEVKSVSVGFDSEASSRVFGPSSDEVQWLTGDTNIVEIRTEVQFIIKDPVLYLYNFADVEDGKRVGKELLLRKIAESVLTDLVAGMKVDDVLASGKVRIQELSRTGVQKIVDELGLGFQLVSVNIVQDSPPDAVKLSFNDVSSAKSDRERLITEADGYAKDLLPRARASANKVVQDAEIYRDEVVNAAGARASRFLQLLEQFRAAPEMTKRRLWYESLEAVMERPKKIVYPRRAGETFRLTEVR